MRVRWRLTKARHAAISFEVFEWSEQLRPVTSVRLGAVCRSVQVRLCTSECKSEKIFGVISPPRDLLPTIVLINPIQARGPFVPPSRKSQRIFKTAWSLELLLCQFSFYLYSIQKKSVPPISHHVCCHGNHEIFGLYLKTQISIVFKVFPSRRNFLWDNFLCFGHHNSLLSSIKAIIRTVTMETVQKILLPKYGHQH